MKNIILTVKFSLIAIIAIAMFNTGCSKPEPEVISHAITISNDGNGTASANVAQSLEGSTVTLTATPKAGYLFKQWVVVSGGVKLLHPTNNPTSFTMPSSAVEIKAEFTEVPNYAITVTNDGNGTANANVAQSLEGSTVTLTATPKTGYLFKQWVVVSGNTTLSKASDNPATFIMPAAAVVVKAEFAQAPTYAITVTNDGNGTASANVLEAKKDVTITLTATSKSGYSFKQWVVVSGNTTLSKASDNPATFAMPAAAVVVKAEFELVRFKVGDYYPDPNVVYDKSGNVTSGTAAIGIVYWLHPSYISGAGADATSTHGKVVGLDESEKLMWNAWEGDYKATSMTDGMVNMNAIRTFIGANPAWSQFIAYNWVASKGEPWYWPSINELQYLYCAYAKITPQIWVSDATPANTTPIGVTRDINTALTAAGGKALSGNTYWSSTQYDNSHFKRVRFTDGFTQNTNILLSCNLRYIRVF